MVNQAGVLGSTYWIPIRFFLSVLMSGGLCYNSCLAQLKFIVEDFEGLTDGTTDLKANGVFTYGNMKANIDYQSGLQRAYSGERFLSVYKEGKEIFGGWGKGIGLNVELDPAKDNVNFYLLQPSGIRFDTVKIELQEDDNSDNAYHDDLDDSWKFQQKVEGGSEWKLISIPLNKFKDSNRGGDGIFNINYREGKLLCFIVSFSGADNSEADQHWSFDFICFSEGKLPTGSGLFDAPEASAADFCSLGIWSKEGNVGNFSDIASGFENNLKYGSEKKLGVVHFFQPFSVDGSSRNENYPSVERINKVILESYVPMITLEDHFPNADPAVKQPNLYSIVEGHFDTFFAKWARQIKMVNGTVLLRILHEFNGDWYPWCIANNDRNPELLVKAFRHIHDIFRSEQVMNVKFIWCPNSTSFPRKNGILSGMHIRGMSTLILLGLMSTTELVRVFYGAPSERKVWRIILC